MLAIRKAFDQDRRPARLGAAGSPCSQASRRQWVRVADPSLITALLPVSRSRRETTSALVAATLLQAWDCERADCKRRTPAWDDREAPSRALVALSLRRAGSTAAWRRGVRSSGRQTEIDGYPPRARRDRNAEPACWVGLPPRAAPIRPRAHTLTTVRRPERSEIGTCSGNSQDGGSSSAREAARRPAARA